ncbi:ATP-binding protein [Halorubrum sp. AD140]|uniref:ATP-binding protein n=1 Tax=Halorubrum sp. AD140 TaxID=3050073 RepID=UPI002ACCC746|nr:ATP-binding protein [Halorubrum sp. AD140]MDZ5811984.1 ATP-binding protein [Halorubrum sp. AD140]
MKGATATIPEAREKLYEIIRRETSFEQKAREALALGKRHLGVENGHLTRVDQETNHWETLVSSDKTGGQFPAGLKLDLEKTYCRRTIETESPIALWNASEQKWSSDPAFEEHGLYCYHGTRLVVDHEPYGTICFVSREPREPFTNDETLFVELMARMLERELEREQHEVALTRQYNLANVLNRVLRHNLKNDMTVVRGHTQLMSDQLGGSEYGETSLSTIDDLLALSEKARELERFANANHERSSTEVTSIVEESIESIQREYPDASISLESTHEEVVADLLPSFERGVHELIHNAAKHGGDSPSVSVSVASVSNAVEIRIVDDGPGLDEAEAEVLKTGNETTLVHGSGLGLWLTHWIVSSHGGSVDATSTDEGTTMTISVPREWTANVEGKLTNHLQASDQYLAAFKGANDAMVIVNDDARIIDANPKASQIYGMDDRALLGQPLTRFFPDGFDFEAFWQKSHEEGTDLDTITLVGGDDVERTVEYSAASKIIPGQTLVVSRDVTERDRREREVFTLKERYETLLDAAPDPVFVADAESGKIVETNGAAETLIGESKENLIGRHHSTLYPDEHAELYQKAFKRAKAEPTSVQILSDGSQPELVTADGDTIPIEFSVNTVSLPDGAVMFGIFRDVALKRENERLDSITSTLSHDLRNPLNVAQGRLGLLKEKCQSEEIETIENAHDRIETLIEDVLTLARNGEPVDETESVVLSDLVESCWKTVETEDATLVVGTERELQADESRLRQLVANVIRNSIVHVGEDVTIAVGDLDDGFFIEDDGTGIPAGERDRIFESGYSTSTEGTGFGLAIVKEIAAAHDWDVTVTNSNSGGARFEVTDVESGVG